MRALLAWRLAGCEVQTTQVGSQDVKEAVAGLVARLGDSARHLVFLSVLADVGDTNGDATAYAHGTRAALRLPAGSNPSMVCAGMLPDAATQLEVALSVSAAVLQEAVGLCGGDNLQQAYGEVGNGTIH